jgi:hypothetical protein
VSDLFETSEERTDRLKKIFFILILFLFIIGGGYFFQQLWKIYHPLPKIEECTKIGYETGMKLEGEKIACYRNCIDNIPRHCRQLKVIP